MAVVNRITESNNYHWWSHKWYLVSRILDVENEAPVLGFVLVPCFLKYCVEFLLNLQSDGPYLNGGQHYIICPLRPNKENIHLAFLSVSQSNISWKSFSQSSDRYKIGNNVSFQLYFRTTHTLQMYICIKLSNGKFLGIHQTHNNLKSNYCWTKAISKNFCILSQFT